MTTTPAVPAAVPTRRLAHILLAVAVALGIGATSCGTKVGATKKDVAATTTTSSSAPQGYSYDHDSRITETP